MVIKECMILEIIKKNGKGSLYPMSSVRFTTSQAGLSKAVWIFHLVLIFTWFSLIDHVFEGEKFSMLNIHEPYLPIHLFYSSFFTFTFHAMCNAGF